MIRVLKYLGITLLIISAMQSQAQILSKPSNPFGTISNRGSFDSTLYEPTGCGIPTDSTFLFSKGFGQGQILKKGAKYYDSCGHHEYNWDPALKAWHIADSSASGGGGITNQDTTIVGNGVSTPLKVVPNLVKSANYFNQPFPFNNNSIFTGTSIFAGYLLDAGQSIINILQRILGNTGVINLAVPSAATRTACWKIAGAATAPWDAPMLSDAAFNNCRWGFATAGIDTAHAFSIINAGARWMAAAQFQNNLQFYRTTAGTVNPNCTITGSAVSVLPADTLKDLASRVLAYSGASPFWRQSMAANDSLIMTNVPGQVISVGLWADSVGGSRAQIYADGILKGTYDPNGRTIMWVDFDAPSSFIRQGLQPDVFIIHGLADTMHTIVVKFLDAGKFGGVDFIGGLKTPQQAALNPIYVMDVLHMTSAGYAVTGGASAVQDSASNSRWANLLATFPEYQTAMVRFNVNTPFGPYDPVNTQEGIHPNGLGARQVAAGIVAVCNPKAAHNAGALTVPGSPDNLLYNNAGALGAAETKFHAALHQLDLGDFNTAGNALRINLLGIQAYDASNIGISYNNSIYSAAYRTTVTGKKATFMQFGEGFVLLKFGPSGTAGSPITWGTGIYFGENGQVGFNGTNVLPGSYFDFIQSSTSFASLNIPKGTRPTSPNNGDVYHDSDDHFYLYHFSAWDRLDNQLGTLGTTNQVIFNDGTGPTGESNFIWDKTNHWLGISGTPSHKLDIGGYQTSVAGFHQGDFFIQSEDGNNTFHGFNNYISGGAYIRAAAKPASDIFYFIDGSVAIGTAPTGSIGSSISWNYGFWANVNGQVQVGGNVSFTPASWVDLPASTTSWASFLVPAGTRPTTGHEGAVYNDNSDHHVYMYLNGTWQQLDGGGGGGGGGPIINAGSTYRVGKIGTDSLKTLTPGVEIIMDTVTANQVKISSDTAASNARIRRISDSTVQVFATSLDVVSVKEFITTNATTINVDTIPISPGEHVTVTTVLDGDRDDGNSSVGAIKYNTFFMDASSTIHEDGIQNTRVEHYLGTSGGLSSANFTITFSGTLILIKFTGEGSTNILGKTTTSVSRKGVPL